MLSFRYLFKAFIPPGYSGGNSTDWNISPCSDVESQLSMIGSSIVILPWSFFSFGEVQEMLVAVSSIRNMKRMLMCVRIVLWKICALMVFMVQRKGLSPDCANAYMK